MSTVSQKLHVHIRWMIRRDMPEVLRIEADAFPYCWTEEDFLDVLRQRNTICLVADHGVRLTGFMVYELHTKRIDILNFGVKPCCRRMSVGTQLVDKIKHKLRDAGRKYITADVRESNLGALQFLHSQCFLAKSVLRGFFEDTGEDAYHMRYSGGPAL